MKRILWLAFAVLLVAVAVFVVLQRRFLDWSASHSSDIGFWGCIASALPSLVTTITILRKWKNLTAPEKRVKVIELAFFVLLPILTFWQWKASDLASAKSEGRLATMSNEVAVLRTVRMRENFTPLSAEVRKAFIHNFTVFRARWPTVTNLHLLPEVGSNNRALLAKEIAECAKEASVLMTVNTGVNPGAPQSNWSMNFASGARDCATELMKVLNTVINDSPVGREREPNPDDNGSIYVSIRGAPLFETNGIVVFEDSTLQTDARITGVRP